MNETIQKKKKNLVYMYLPYVKNNYLLRRVTAAMVIVGEMSLISRRHV